MPNVYMVCKLYNDDDEKMHGEERMYVYDLRIMQLHLSGKLTSLR